MKITYHITREDFIDAQKLHRSKSPSALGRAIVLMGKILAGAGVLMLVVLAAVDRDRKLWANLAPLIVIVSSLVVGYVGVGAPQLAALLCQRSKIAARIHRGYF
jgi:hypothetical protein